MTCIFGIEKLRSGNKMLTQGLFTEYRHQTTGGDTAIYTLKEQDHNDCISMYKVFIDSSSEYEAAQKLLGSWNHWKKLCKCSWFKPHLEDWKEEIKIREAAIGKATLIDAALDGNVTAAKELVNQLNKKSSPGRPSTKQVESNNDRLKKVDEKVVSLLTRMDNV